MAHDSREWLSGKRVRLDDQSKRWKCMQCNITGYLRNAKLHSNLDKHKPSMEITLIELNSTLPKADINVTNICSLYKEHNKIVPDVVPISFAEWNKEKKSE